MPQRPVRCCATGSWRLFSLFAVRTASVASVVRWSALDALSHQFELCRIGSGTTVVALVDGTASDELVRVALARLGADAVLVETIAEHSAAGTGGDVLSRLAAAVDIVVDATRNGTAIPERLGETRWLRVHEQAGDALHTPSTSLARRIDALVDDIVAAERLVLSDRHGAQLQIDLGNVAIRADDGVVAAPGATGSYPTGWIELTPAASSVSGDIVLMPGDTNLATGDFVRSPTRLSINDDLLTAIDGDHGDGDAIRALIEHLDDPLAYGVSRLTLGMHALGAHEEIFDPKLVDPLVARLTGGVVTIAFGDNPHAGRACTGTVALGLRNRTVALDNTVVVNAGHLWGPYAPDVYERPT